MTSANKTIAGLAYQDGNTAETAGFMNFAFSRGGLMVANQFVTAEDGISPNALSLDMQKTGAYAQGSFEFVPHAKSIGMMLLGALGKEDPVANAGTSTTAKKHTFKLNGADEYALPKFTFRQATGQMYGEVFNSCRFTALAFEFAAANYLRATLGVIGDIPDVVDDISTWDKTVDASPTFITTLSSITGVDTGLKVVRGGLTIGAAIPMDEQFIVGSTRPDAFDVTQRVISVNLTAKITNADLAKKFVYDPAGGASWVASVLREGGAVLDFISSQAADQTANEKYRLSFKFDPASDNVVWAAQPVPMQAGRQILMNITGQVLGTGDTASASPLVAELVNLQTAKYDV